MATALLLNSFNCIINMCVPLYYSLTAGRLNKKVNRLNNAVRNALYFPDILYIERNVNGEIVNSELHAYKNMCLICMIFVIIIHIFSTAVSSMQLQCHCEWRRHWRYHSR